MTSAPILVTGAGGFVCSEIALALHRAGQDVVTMDQAFDPATTQRLRAIRRIEGGLVDMLSTPVAHGPFSAVIHGAAITASPEQLGLTPAAHIRRNMDMLTATLEHAHAAGATRFLFLSSMGVFDPGDMPAPDRQFTEATQSTASCTYCAAKRAGELLTGAAAQDGFATVSLRLGNVFGPHEAVRVTRQNLSLVSRMIAEARASGRITVQTPQVKREWSWLPDLADAIAELVLSYPWEGPSVRHAGTPPVINDLALAHAIATRIGGTTVHPAEPPHGAVRPPMASAVSGPLQQVRWTRMADALDVLIPMEATI